MIQHRVCGSTRYGSGGNAREHQINLYILLIYVSSAHIQSTHIYIYIARRTRFFPSTLFCFIFFFFRFVLSSPSLAAAYIRDSSIQFSIFREFLLAREILLSIIYRKIYVHFWLSPASLCGQNKETIFISWYIGCSASCKRVEITTLAARMICAPEH